MGFKKALFITTSPVMPMTRRKTKIKTPGLHFKKVFIKAMPAKDIVQAETSTKIFSKDIELGAKRLSACQKTIKRSAKTRNTKRGFKK
jgi:hypothetical protein